MRHGAKRPDSARAQQYDTLFERAFARVGVRSVREAKE